VSNDYLCNDTSKSNSGMAANLESRARILKTYESAEGKEFFWSWLNGLRDLAGAAKIKVRLNRAEQGNYGDCSTVGEGVKELKIDFGPGYRVYFGEDANDVILLGGGDKSTQSADIVKAKERWRDYNA
jgi:putative addiction module killer protein